MTAQKVTTDTIETIQMGEGGDVCITESSDKHLPRVSEAGMQEGSISVITEKDTQIETNNQKNAIENNDNNNNNMGEQNGATDKNNGQEIEKINETNENDNQMSIFKQSQRYLSDFLEFKDQNTFGKFLVFPELPIVIARLITIPLMDDSVYCKFLSVLGIGMIPFVIAFTFFFGIIQTNCNSLIFFFILCFFLTSLTIFQQNKN